MPPGVSTDAVGREDSQSLYDTVVRTDVMCNEVKPLKVPNTKIKTIYLVDFENVGLDALVGIENLESETERLFLFSTEKAPRIPTATLVKILDIQRQNADVFKIYEVPVKSQSVDMHLVSYLGYLIAVYGTSCNYVIVSADTDYDNIVKYWKTLEKVNVKRRGKEAIKQSVAEKKTEPEKQPERSTSTIEETPSPVTNKQTTPDEDFFDLSVSLSDFIDEPEFVSQRRKTKIDWDAVIQKAVISAGYSEFTSIKVAWIVCQNRYNPDCLQRVRDELGLIFPGDNNLYNVVRSAIAEQYLSQKYNIPTQRPTNLTPTLKPAKSRSFRPPKSDSFQFEKNTIYNQLDSALQKYSLKDYTDVVYSAFQKCSSPSDFYQLLRAEIPCENIASIAYRVASSVCYETKTKLEPSENELVEKLTKEGFDKPTIEYTVALVTKYTDNVSCLWLLRNAITEKFGNEKGLKIYNLIQNLF